MLGNQDNENDSLDTKRRRRKVILINQEKGMTLDFTL
jgi:hypothetical protein